MTQSPLIIRPRALDLDESVVRGSALIIGDWPAQGDSHEVAPLHVHHSDDEAWHVISGALHFRFADETIEAEAGSTVLVPAGVPHTFGNAGPERSRFIMILPSRLDDLIKALHAAQLSDHAEIYARYDSQLLE
jgi:uncharacterized cupin superfamily protein